MSNNLPGSKGETREPRARKNSSSQFRHADQDPPHFTLLDTGGPEPWSIVLSSALLTVLFVLLVVLARPSHRSAPFRPRTTVQLLTPRRPLFVRQVPPVPRVQNSRLGVPQHLQRSALVTPSKLPQVSILSTETAAQEIPAAPTLSMPKQVASPLSPVRIAPHIAEPVSPAARISTPAAREVVKSTPPALGSLPLQRLLEREAILAADLAALPRDQRLALPRVSIRVNAEWLQVLPQTQEKLYFSVTIPEAGTEVLAYSPAARDFTLERPLRPLWRIHDVERVPALAALRVAAARQLRVPPDLVGLYTWHPAVFESALQMFVLQRMKQSGVQLGPGDVVTVCLASAPGGYVMKLEPIRSITLR